MINLDNNQAEIVKNANGKIAVAACPGSGKTRVLIERADFLISNGFNSSDILIVTFTNKARREIEERCKEKNIFPLVETFHSLALKISSRFNRKHNLPNLDILSNNEVVILLNQSTTKMIREKRIPDKLTSNLNSFTHSKKIISGNTDLKLLSDLYSLDELKIILEEYNKVKKQCNKIDFDDLISIFVNILKNNNDIGLENIRHLMVDECQDLNIEQHEIVETMFKKYNMQSLMLVGDLDQSIYTWRGAKPELFKSYYEQSDSKYHLDNNYRSGNEIINLATYIIGQDNTRIPMKINTTKKEINKVELYNFNDDKSSVVYLAEYIAKNKELLGKTAILLRTEYLSEVIIPELIRCNVQYNLLTDSLSSCQEIEDLLHIIRLIKGNSVISFIYVLKKYSIDLFGDFISKLETLSLNNLNAFIEEAKKNNITEKNLIKTTSCVRGNVIALEKVLRTILEVRNFTNLNLSSRIAIVIKKTEMSKFWKHEMQSKVLVQKALNHIDNKFRDFNYNEDDILTEITLDLSSIVDKKTFFNDEAIDIMTMHSSKGLEYDTIILPFINDGTMPHKKTSKDGDEVSELRLLYVAVTRARSRLIITSTNGLTSKFIR